jgi:hypothetical protein
MTQRILTPTIIAARALMILENNLVMAKQVYRGYEDEFDDKHNGYMVGDTISIRRPTDFTVRDGAVMAVQEVNEGKTSITVDKQKGVDFRFTSKQLTLDIDELSERVIEPAMIQLANQIDVDLMARYVDVYNWVGTPGQTINSFADFYEGPQRLNEYGVPADGRSAVLSPADHGGLLGSQTALYIADAAKDAYRRGSLGMLGDVDTYMSQNVPSHTNGSRTGGASTALMDAPGSSLISTTISYDDVKDTMVQTIHVDTLVGATDTIRAGDILTIADVWAVNPVTKARLPFLKQFVVTATVTAASNETDLVISPPIIWTGAQQNVSITAVSNLHDQAITFLGTASTIYRQNMVFNKNAFALVMVPMVKPAGAVDVTRKSYKGCSVRMIPTYDGVNDVSAYRLDVLYGTKTLDARQAVRLSGT